MSGEQRFYREETSAIFTQKIGIVVIILFCALGLFITISVFPSYDTWTPSQLLTSP
jgi:hypothetical protein